MLVGQNGILTNAQKANNNNVYYSADEQVKLAYMAVKTQIMTEKVANSSYNAVNNAGRLAKQVRQDLDGTDWKVEVGSTAIAKDTPEATINATTGTAIKITYTNSKIIAGSMGNGKPAESGTVEYIIYLQEQEATLNTDTGYSKDVVEKLKIESNTSKWVQFAGNSTKYRVLYDATSPYGIEVISDKNVGEAVELGKNDPAGNNVTGAGNVNTSDRAIWSYTNAIDTLNKAAEQRADISSNLVSQVRCVGSRPSNKNFKITDKYYNDVITMFDTSYFTSPTNHNGLYEQGVGVYQYDDVNQTGNWAIQNHNYTEDWNKMGTLNIRTTGEDYWLASRRVGAYTSYTYFYVCCVTAEGGYGFSSLFYVDSSGIGTGAPSRGVRPVCRLASGVQITGGNGTEGSPYIISK